MSDYTNYQGDPSAPMSQALDYANPTPAMTQAFRDSIGDIESKGSGGYSAVGPKTKSGDQAYGRYQVMGSNVGPWTQEVLGQAMTPDEFRANPQAQDQVFDAKFGQGLQKHGNLGDAASVWFTGKPLSQGANASDGNLTGQSYADKFQQGVNARLGMANYKAIDPDAPAPGASPASMQGQPGASGFAVPGQNQGQPQSFWDKVKAGGPGALLGLPDNGARPWDLGSALTQASIAAMARDNPAGAQAMAQLPAMQARAYMPRFNTTNYQPQTGNAIITDQRTGQVQQRQVGAPFQQMPEAEWTNFGTRNTDINNLNYTQQKLNDIRQQIAGGQLDLSGVSRVRGMLDNGLNISDPNDQKIANYIHQIGLVHQADMSMAKGTQTDADSDNMMKALLPEGSGTDNAQVLQSLDNVINKRRVALESNIQAQKGTVSKYGSANGSQLPNGPWYSPDYYDHMSQNWDKADQDFAPKRQQFLAQRAAAQDGSSGDTGQPMPKPSASPKSGSTGETGGSLANGGNPIAPADVAKLSAGIRFRGVDGKIYRSVGPAQSDQSNGALPPGFAPAI